MKKTEWPIRWDLLLRYRLIEIVALWEGRLTTNHICHAFGIGRQQASKDINTYLREIAPGNLDYDRHLKGYIPTAEFQPKVTRGIADEYLQLLTRDKALRETFEELNIGLPNAEVLEVPLRNVRAEVLRPVILAARHGRKLKCHYVSLSNPVGDERVIEPHTLVYTGQRWHVRAWCEKNGEFRDFVLSRFRGEPELLEEKARHRARHDARWAMMARIVIRPDSRLSEAQQALIATDYGMQGGVLELPVRGVLVHYALRQLNLETGKVDADPLRQQIELANLEELKGWL